MSTEDPKPVYLRYPPFKTATQVGKLVGSVSYQFFKAYILMLTLGALHSKLEYIPVLGYWYSLVAIIAVGSLFPTRTSSNLFSNGKDLK